MKNIKLDSILLFALVIPFIMNYRLSPGDTPFWLFGLIFLSMLSYMLLDIIKLKEKLFFRLKYLLLGFVIISVIGSAIFSSIVVRHKTHPIYMIHDIIIQQEAAIRFIIDGKNPYAVTYFGTPLEQWHYSDKDINPALYHFVMQPFYVLFAMPFYFMSNVLFGFFDGRIPLFILFICLLFLAAKLVKDPSQKLLFIIIFAFNPAMLGYTLEGRSDIFMFAFLFFGLYLLHVKKYFASGIPIALAFAVKQSAWPILPFYFAYLFFKEKNLKKTLLAISSFAVSFIAVTIPFFLWNPKAFLDSTIFYLSGNTEHSYPISGYGLGKLLESFGFIKDIYASYPFYIWQFIICIPLLFFLIKYLRKHSNVKTLILLYGIFLFVFWYLSRYFNNSHLGYLSLVFITAYFWPENEKN
jgi:uncharacterized membrane protein